MAGIGVRLNRIFEKNTLTTNLVGFFYSTVVTVAPMFVIIINLILMEYLLDFASVGYVTRELFSCTILYTFIFSLLTASPFNAVLSRYMSDVIYEERYQDILPCYHIGMLLNIGLSCLIGDSVLSLGTFCGKGTNRICILWLLRLYQSGACFLLDDLSFYLQRLSTDFTVFFLRHAGGICPCPDFTLYSEVGDNMEYAVFSDDRIFCDGNAGKCADPPVFCAK